MCTRGWIVHEAGQSFSSLVQSLLPKDTLLRTYLAILHDLPDNKFLNLQEELFIF